MGSVARGAKAWQGPRAAILAARRDPRPGARPRCGSPRRAAARLHRGLQPCMRAPHPPRPQRGRGCAAESGARRRSSVHLPAWRGRCGADGRPQRQAAGVGNAPRPEPAHYRPPRPLPGRHRCKMPCRMAPCPPYMDARRAPAAIQLLPVHLVGSSPPFSHNTTYVYNTVVIVNRGVARPQA